MVPASITVLSLIGIGVLGTAPDPNGSEPSPVATSPAPPAPNHQNEDLSSSTPAPRPSETLGEPLSQPAASREDLDGLRVVERSSTDTSYSRSAFGGSWVDTDRNGCNQRDDVLLRDAVPGSVRVQQQGSCGHDVIAGEWIDPYNGKRIALENLKDTRQAQAIQIDHIVPLKEAWLSGAREWPEAKRVAFANDLQELAAVDGPTNASKGDGDPAAWRPRKQYQCAYANRWVGTKRKWDLAADPSEITALQQMLRYCQS